MKYEIAFSIHNTTFEERSLMQTALRDIRSTIDNEVSFDSPTWVEDVKEYIIGYMSLEYDIEVVVCFHSDEVVGNVFVITLVDTMNRISATQYL